MARLIVEEVIGIVKSAEVFSLAQRGLVVLSGDGGVGKGAGV